MFQVCSNEGHGSMGLKFNIGFHGKSFKNLLWKTQQQQGSHDLFEKSVGHDVSSCSNEGLKVHGVRTFVGHDASNVFK